MSLAISVRLDGRYAGHGVTLSMVNGNILLQGGQYIHHTINLTAEHRQALGCALLEINAEQLARATAPVVPVEAPVVKPELELPPDPPIDVSGRSEDSNYQLTSGQTRAAAAKKAGVKPVKKTTTSKKSEGNKPAAKKPAKKK